MSDPSRPEFAEPKTAFAAPPAKGAPRSQAPSPQRPEKAGSRDTQLDSLLHRIQNLTDRRALQRRFRWRLAGDPASRPTPAAPYLPPEPKTYLEAGLSETQVEQLVMKYLLVPWRCPGSKRGEPPETAIYPGRPATATPQARTTGGLPRCGRGQRLSVPANRPGSRTGAPLQPGVQLFWLRSGHAGMLHPVRPSSIADRATSQRTRIEAGFWRSVDQSPYVAATRTGDQFGPRHVPLRISGQWQDEYCGARDALLWRPDLDSAGDRRRRRHHSGVRSQPSL